MTMEIVGGRTLLPNGFIDDARVIVQDGFIDRVEGNGVLVERAPGDERLRLAQEPSHGSGSIGSVRTQVSGVLNASGCFVLPGIVDFHGDAFETAIAPRDGSQFDLSLAFRFVDAQLVSCGITTGCYSPTLTWETHRTLRNDEGARRIIEGFNAIKRSLRADSLLHLRWEIHHLGGEKLVHECLERGMVDLLAFNDHLSWMRERLANPRTRARMELAFGSTDSELDTVADKIDRRKPLTFEAVERIAAFAQKLRVPMCAHDEESREQREWYHGRGCRIAEFPVNEIAARTGRDLGDEVVLGAPNVLKGGSLYGRLSGRDAISAQLCTVLASDYYYPSLLYAPFLLDEIGVAPFEDAWNLVSRNPARALGLLDRGTIAPGRRADLVLVRRHEDGTISVAASLVAGKVVYLDG
jgi:alpha-D-ribose 1-methylphosphonate 5-triphosphate diphosphatase